MKKTIITSISIVIFAISCLAQSENSVCPKIEITGGGVVGEGMIMSFAVKLDGEVRENLNYEWTVSSGKIIDGQGSLAIKVDTIGLDGGTNVKAEVKLKGLPENCANTFSEGGSVVKIDREPLDSYGKISFYDERARLDTLRLSLDSNPEYLGLIMLKIEQGRNFNNEKRRRIKNILKHLRFFQISFNRIVFSIEKTSSFGWTTIGVVFKDEDYSNCEKCEIIKADEFK